MYVTWPKGSVLQAQSLQDSLAARPRIYLTRPAKHHFYALLLVIMDYLTLEKLVVLILANECKPCNITSHKRFLFAFKIILETSFKTATKTVWHYRKWSIICRNSYADLMVCLPLQHQYSLLVSTYSYQITYLSYWNTVRITILTVHVSTLVGDI